LQEKDEVRGEGVRERVWKREGEWKEEGGEVRGRGREGGKERERRGVGGRERRMGEGREKGRTYCSARTYLPPSLRNS
jgi:hypothetical protein